MTLNSLERDFLKRLSLEAWTSPPIFDHGLLDHLVQEGLVISQTLTPSGVRYEITDRGREAITAAEH